MRPILYSSLLSFSSQPSSIHYRAFLAAKTRPFIKLVLLTLSPPFLSIHRDKAGLPKRAKRDGFSSLFARALWPRSREIFDVFDSFFKGRNPPPKPYPSRYQIFAIRFLLLPFSSPASQKLDMLVARRCSALARGLPLRRAFASKAGVRILLPVSSLLASSHALLVASHASPAMPTSP